MPSSLIENREWAFVMYKARLQLPSLLYGSCGGKREVDTSCQALVLFAKPLLLVQSLQGSYPTSTACAGSDRRVGVLGACLLSWIETPRSFSFGSGPSSVLLLQSQEVSSTRCRLMARPASPVANSGKGPLSVSDPSHTASNAEHRGGQAF